MKKIKLILSLVSFVLVGNAYTQSFSYELTGDPVDITDWTMGGDATIEGESIILTEAVNYRIGYIHYGTPQVLSGECSYFSVDFDYKITSTAGVLPADGLAFWFLENPPVGFIVGGGIGLPPNMTGFGMVIDTWDNDGNLNNPLFTLRSFDEVNWDEGDLTGLIAPELHNQDFVHDATWRHVRIVYEAGVMSVYLDYATTPNMSGPIDLDGMVGYFGFSAATGGSYAQHEIRNVFIQGADNPEPPTVSNKMYCQHTSIGAVAVDEMLDSGILHWYLDPVGGEELPEAPYIDSSIVSVQTYYVSQSTELCELESDRVAITVEVRPLPTIDVNANVTLACLGSTVELEAIVNPEMDDLFSINWTPAASLSAPTSLITEATPTVTTLYTATVNSGVAGCEATDTVTISVIPGGIELVNNDTVVCAGSVVPLNVIGHTALEYRWTPDTYIDNPLSRNTAITATESGMIYITASHPACPDANDSFYMEVQPVPTVDLGDDITLCAGDTAQLFVSTVPEYDGYVYDWTLGWKLSDSTIKDPIFNGFSTEEFIVSVTTPLGCVTYDTILVTVNQSNFASTNFSDTVVCGAYSLQLQASGGVSYQWLPAVGLDSDTISNPIASLDAEIEYTVIAKSEAGCLDTQYVRIQSASAAIITMPDSMIIYSGEDQEIDITSNASYFSWYPPEGLSSNNIANPVASPNVRTRYFLTATTEHGCQALDSIDVVVNLDPVFDIPNAFVPGNNFEGNATFKVIKRGDLQLSMFKIYNRWGNLMFETTDIEQGWDGTLDGTPQPMGVYVYMIELVTPDGRRVQRQGNVTLVR